MSAHREHLAELERGCEGGGFALTMQRRAVLEALARREDHPTADEVHQGLPTRHRGVSRATVFRTLESLAELGLLVRVCHPDASTRYDVKTHRHHHLICDSCGAIQDLEDARLNDLRLPKLSRQGFEVHDFSVHLRGTCAACRARDDA